jgi:hypothetical protein
MARVPARWKKAMAQVRKRAMVESDDPALLYGCAAQKHVRVAFGAEQVTTVWAPTGIAIASPFRGSASNCTGARSR